MDKVSRYTKLLKSYDKELFAQCNKGERVDVYRQTRDKTSPPYYIFSLTDNWTTTGRPVEWGSEVIYARLRAIDLWNSGVGVDQVIEQNEKVDESKQRALRNNIESFMYEFRRQFAKATDGINTANLKKLYRKENENGYCESRTGFVTTSR